MTATPEPCPGNRWAAALRPYVARASRPRDLVVEGKLTRMVGLALAAVGCKAAVGDRVQVLRDGAHPVDTEVVGFSGEELLLMPIGEVRGLEPSARVVPTSRGGLVPVGDSLLGRVVDGRGKPIDGHGALRCRERVPLCGRSLNPLGRRPVRSGLDVGVRAINALLPVGVGQRLGLFAGSGLGKSSLLGMMTRSTRADVIVVGLIGERSREVNEFIEETLGPAGMARAVVVASPADDPPLLRLHGAWLATAIAEYFRDQGLQVLLLMDSLTRFAQAQREIALAIGEPPATRGFPPSVFARIPQLVERAGNGAGGVGGITAIFTVLTEDDDGSDPVAESARAILDGHIVLSRELAEQGVYPSIDVEHSVSRVMGHVIGAEDQARVHRFRRIWSTYQRNADLVSVGAYVKGSDPRLDEAIEMHPRLVEFIRQAPGVAVTREDSLAALAALLDGDGVRDDTGAEHEEAAA